MLTRMRNTTDSYNASTPPHLSAPALPPILEIMIDVSCDQYTQVFGTRSEKGHAVNVPKLVDGWSQNSRALECLTCWKRSRCSCGEERAWNSRTQEQQGGSHSSRIPQLAACRLNLAHGDYIYLLLDINDCKNTRKSASSDFRFGNIFKVFPHIIEI